VSFVLLIFTPRMLCSYCSERGLYDIHVRSMNIDDQQPTDSVLFAHFGKFQMTISLEHKIRSTSCFVQGWGFRGRQIERHYYVFAQIQDGG